MQTIGVGVPGFSAAGPFAPHLLTLRILFCVFLSFGNAMQEGSVLFPVGRFYIEGENIIVRQLLVELASKGPISNEHEKPALPGPLERHLVVYLYNLNGLLFLLFFYLLTVIGTPPFFSRSTFL